MSNLQQLILQYFPPLSQQSQIVRLVIVVAYQLIKLYLKFMLYQDCFFIGCFFNSYFWNNTYFFSMHFTRGFNKSVLWIHTLIHLLCCSFSISHLWIFDLIVPLKLFSLVLSKFSFSFLFGFYHSLIWLYPPGVLFLFLKNQTELLYLFSIMIYLRA